MKPPYAILLFFSCLFLLGCKEKKTNPPSYTTSVVINGEEINTNNTKPTNEGYYSTLYFNEATKDVSFNLKNMKTGDNIVVVIKATKSISNVNIQFDDQDNYGYFYPKNIIGTKNKSKGSIYIHNLSIINNKIENYDASFSFIHSYELEGNPYSNEVNNGIIKNLSQTL